VVPIVVVGPPGVGAYVTQKTFLLSKLHVVGAEIVFNTVPFGE
jgi:hypothetical protein